MKTPLSWISLYSPLSSLLREHSLKELAHTYSIHTAEIDGIEDHFLDKVVIGKVISCEKHAESKKLSIVEVNIGNGETTMILTGAANISEAHYVPVALVGAVLPGDFTIGERMMAGMLSRGMICSDDELGLATERAEGIMILENIWNSDDLEKMIGQSFFDFTLPFPGLNGDIYSFPLRDATFEIDNKFITNRPDLFSVYGNAREWHTVFSTPFTEYQNQKGERVLGECKKTFPLTIETDKCFAYNAWKMNNIQVGKSPWGMSLMMERSGLSAKMDIVDITNCIMTELGQPMHAFDADKVHGSIIVRNARAGEMILALNGTQYQLSEQDMIIADERGPIAIAGVIGGMESAVSESTTSIIWESACFDPISVRLTAQRHGLRTDASTRYEKSLDPLLTKKVFTRVLDYMAFLGKDTTLDSQATYFLPSSVNTLEITLSYEFLNKKIGVFVPESEVKKILSHLGFVIKKEEGGTLVISIPSWRATKDIDIKEDIAEEVGRVYGYDNVPLIPLTANFSISEKNTDKSLCDATLGFFSNAGWNEVYNYSFSSNELDTQLGLTESDEGVTIKNAFNREYTNMRRSLALRLLGNIRENERHGAKLRFFEIGNIYTKNGRRNNGVEELLKKTHSIPFSERKMLAGVCQTSISELRTTIETYLENLLGFIPPLHQENGSLLSFLHPGISGCYTIGDETIVRFGQIHPGVSEAYSIAGHTYYFEIEYATLLELLKENDRRFQPLSRFQSITRELNFVVEEHIRTGEIARHIDATHPWIHDVYVDSIFRDENKIGKGMKSVNFSFKLINTDDTISDNDALEVQNIIIAHMKEFGYNLRTI